MLKMSSLRTLVHAEMGSDIDPIDPIFVDPVVEINSAWGLD